MSPGVSARLLATQSDRRLLELVRKGYERAFEAIVLRYRRPLLAYCRRLGLSEPRAEDVLQQALLKAWVALQGGAEVRELRPWLYRIVHNTAVNALRAPEERLRAAEPPALELAAAQPEIEHRLAAQAALTDVAALPPMQREALLMSAVDGRSHEEVASALGVSQGAVRGLLYRARSALRDAAAAIVPPPVIAWALGGASRMAPTATRLAELSGPAGGDMGGAVLKCAAVCATAALAAGAVIVPLHGGGKRASSPGRHPTLTVLGSRPSQRAATIGAAARPVSATLLRSRATVPVAGAKGSAGLLPASSGGPRGVTRGNHRNVSSISPSQALPGAGTAAPTSAAVGTSGHAAESSPSSGEGEHGGGSGTSGGKAPEPPAGGGSGGGGSSGGEPEGGQPEHSGGDSEEEAIERREQEAEEARERAEREAEEAGEHGKPEGEGTSPKDD